MKVIIALDLASKKENLKLAMKCQKYPIWLKVGLRSFLRDGQSLLYDLKAINPSFNIFLDLKLYDIPKTVIDSVYEISKLPVDLITIHASLGFSSMKSLVQSVKVYQHKPLIFAVTALTSFDEAAFQSIYEKPILEKAMNMASLAYKAGLDGVVCSCFESLNIKAQTNHQFKTLCPGIRLENTIIPQDDQARTANIAFARKQKADFIVLGRAIYQASNVEKKLAKLMDDISQVMLN